MHSSIGEQLVKELFAAMKERNWDKLENMIHPAFQSVHYDGARNGSQEMILLKGLNLGDLPPNLVPQVKLGFFHFMFINEAMLAVPEDDYSTSCAA